MRMKTFFSTVAATFGMTSAYAGGLSPEVMEAPVVLDDVTAAPATSSINPTYVVLGVLAALLIAAAVNDDDDDDDEPILTE